MEKIIARERLVRWNENLKKIHEKNQSHKTSRHVQYVFIGYAPLSIHPSYYRPSYYRTLYYRTLYYSTSIRIQYYIGKSTYMSFLQHSNIYDHES